MDLDNFRNIMNHDIWKMHPSRRAREASVLKQIVLDIVLRCINHSLIYTIFSLYVAKTKKKRGR